MHDLPPYVEARDFIRVRTLVRGDRRDGHVIGWRGERVYLQWRSDEGNHLGWGPGGGCRAQVAALLHGGDGTYGALKPKSGGASMAEAVRVAGLHDARVVAQLLDDFNREYETPSPGVAVLTERLQKLLGGREVYAVLVGEPVYGVALLTLRPNVWYAGPVGLLDELYVVPSRRGQGLGTALLRDAEEVVRGRGGEVLEINVDGDDAAARRFYERHGYRNSEPGKDEQLLYYFREF